MTIEGIQEQNSFQNSMRNKPQNFVKKNQALASNRSLKNLIKNMSSVDQQNEDQKDDLNMMTKGEVKYSFN